MLTETDFLGHVANHQMEIAHDDETLRYIRFRKNGTDWLHWFDIVTVPGMLTITGDYGTFSFRRLDDMFDFFRGDKQDGPLYVNLGYWAEKVVSEDRRSGVENYSPEKFKKLINEIMDECEVSDEVRENVKDEVLNYAECGEETAVHQAYEFRHGDFEFCDIHEYSLKDYTYLFAWNCYAIAWAIRQYDAAKIESLATQQEAHQ